MARSANKLRRSFLAVCITGMGWLVAVSGYAQLNLKGNALHSIDYSNPKTFELGGITVSGTQSLDPNAIILLTGLTIGEKIEVPGDAITRAIKNLWDQGLFSDISVSYSRIQGGKIYLDFYVMEQPRLSRFKFEGVTKSEADDIREQINLYREKIVTKNLLFSTKNSIRTFFVDKGYLNTDVELIQKDDSTYANHVIMTIKVDKKKKVKIQKIYVNGNQALSDRALKKSMKETKERSVLKPFHELDDLLKNVFKLGIVQQRSDTVPELLSSYVRDRVRIRIFKNSKFIRSNYNTDKQAVIAKYNAKGYRDARIVDDSIKVLDDKNIEVYLNVEEGSQYYFRNIQWVGNTKYTSQRLNEILGIEKGDIYNPEILDTRLFMNPSGVDISSLYMDDGYLFFQVTPVETKVENDSIDLEIRLYEGQQARIDKIIITGNTKTNEHVIRREIRTKPGQLFNRSDIIRTQRELALLGYFDPEQMNVVPQPNPEEGTVDIEYQVAERPSDQIELSGGFGAGTVVGTFGISFSNFSTRNFFKKGAWSPLPSGDGQRLSIRAQTNGRWFQSYNISFTEPWLGGKRPNALSVSTYYSIQTNGEPRSSETRRSLDIFGVSVGLGRRLSWPDDNFQLYQEISFQNYNVNQFQSFQGFDNGHANNIFYKMVFSRSSIDDLNYPRSGSQTSLTAQLTPPYSWFNDKDYSTLDSEERFRFIEYHKWKFTSAWYTTLTGKMVLYTKVGFGGLFRYTNEVGDAPFERFYMGGSGLTGFQLDAREIIGLRGYQDNQVLAEGTRGGPNTGGMLINKYTAELRYPFSLNPQAMVYGLGFVEAGNTWTTFLNYDPFDVYRAAGVGIRIFLPMFGMLGLDWGYRFDDVPGTRMPRSDIFFTIGANLGEL